MVFVLPWFTSDAFHEVFPFCNLNNSLPVTGRLLCLLLLFIYLFLVQVFVDLLEPAFACVLATIKAQLLLSFCYGLAGALTLQVCRALNQGCAIFA